MANTASPYGLRPVNLIGGQPYAGSFREIPVTSNIATAIYNGDVVQMGGVTAGQPNPITATPTAGTTPGIVGVCVGARYQNPSSAGGQWMYSQYLPANAITNGYTNVYIRVVDDPDALFQVQAVGSVAATLRGKFAALENFGGSIFTGNSIIRLSTPANTATLAMRIVDFVDAGSNYTDCIVKFNFGVHMYYNAIALSN
jgi:hypothetical protein